MYLILCEIIIWGAYCHSPLWIITSVIKAQCNTPPHNLYIGKATVWSDFPASASLTVYHLGISRVAPHKLHI